MTKEFENFGVFGYFPLLYMKGLTLQCITSKFPYAQCENQIVPLHLHRQFSGKH